MDNVEVFVEGDILTITVDLSKDLGPSSTGKTNMVATSKGIVAIPGTADISMGLNIFKKKKSK